MTKKKKARKVAAPKKKVAPKKGNGKKTMVTVSGSMCFWVNNGPVLSNLKDLHKALIRMSDKQFAYHVNRGKNDFAAWVRGVLSEEEVARKLLKAKTKREALKVVASKAVKYK